MARQAPPNRYTEPYFRSLGRPGPTPVGIAVLLVLALGLYLAFSKQIPFTGNGYTLSATFANSANIRTDSPVRIAGVNVGKVLSVSREGDASKVTFTVDSTGRPVHADAFANIRPRIFLEGNFFIDLQPGSPSAPDLPSGGAIPITHTATAVQLDQVLTALQAPTRGSLRQLLVGYGTALAHRPTAAEDVTQDPDVQGKTAAQALNQSFTYGAEAGRGTAQVNQALLGTAPHDLSRLIASSEQVFGQLVTHQEQLKGLLTNFNITTGALASQAGNLAQTVHLLAPTLQHAHAALLHLNEALPPLRTWAITVRPAIAEIPATINAANPWLDQANPLLSGSELGGIAKLLRTGSPGLARATHATIGALPQIKLASLCTSGVLVPTGNQVINDSFGTGVPNYRELFYSAVGLAGESQNFDGNGAYVRVQPGGGNVRVKEPSPGAPAGDDVLFGNTITAPQGSQPRLNGEPPKKPKVKCYTNQVPDLNGPAAAVGPPSPSP